MQPPLSEVTTTFLVITSIRDMAYHEKDDLMSLLKLPSSPEALRTKTKNTSGFPQSPTASLSLCPSPTHLQNNFTARIHLTTKYGSKPLPFFSTAYPSDNIPILLNRRSRKDRNEEEQAEIALFKKQIPAFLPDISNVTILFARHAAHLLLHARVQVSEVLHIAPLYSCHF